MANLLYELLVEVPTDLCDVIHEISDPDDQGDITQQETGQSDTETNDMKPTDVMYYCYSEWAHREALPTNAVAQRTNARRASLPAPYTRDKGQVICHAFRATNDLSAAKPYAPY